MAFATRDRRAKKRDNPEMIRRELEIRNKLGLHARAAAKFVRCAGTFESRVSITRGDVEVDGKRYKEYYGSASDFNKGEYKHVEGKRILEPIKGTLADTLREMREDLQSSISYAGGTQLADLRKVNYVVLGGENAGEHLFM